MPQILVISIFVYFLVLFGISFLFKKDTRNSTFFMAHRNSPWYVVSFGMLGASISGITFISVPGWVLTSGFSYMQMVFGFIFGYLFIAWVLLPVYYKLQVTSIYSYLALRFGKVGYKTGASYFLISKLLATAPILYVVISIIQSTVSDFYHIPFLLTVVIVIVFIWLYTFRSGLLTILWTDVLQTGFMLLAIVLTIYAICHSFHWSVLDAFHQIRDSQYSQLFVFEHFKSGNYFWKSFLAGIFIPIVMTGMDQDKMQKNLTCKTLAQAQKNIIITGLSFTPVNLLFLCLGVLLALFANAHGIVLPEKTDQLFPTVIASGALPAYIGVVFILGLVAATYSSADSALTAMTTSFCVDILVLQGDSRKNRTKRLMVHLAFSILLVILVMGIEYLHVKTVLDLLYKIVGYSYGPLLGLFTFGLFTKIQTKGSCIPYVAGLSILLSFCIEQLLKYCFQYQMGYELLIMNGMLTFAGLYLCRDTQKKNYEY